MSARLNAGGADVKGNWRAQLDADCPATTTLAGVLPHFQLLPTVLSKMLPRLQWVRGGECAEMRGGQRVLTDVNAASRPGLLIKTALSN